MTKGHNSHPPTPSKKKNFLFQFRLRFHWCEQVLSIINDIMKYIVNDKLHNLLL